MINEHILKKFLFQYTDSAKPLLLGLSGGPDSMVLFYLLLQLKKKEGLKFGIAHINHNWREESGDEAIYLQNQAIQANVPFHLLSLDPQELNGNLELACREERLKFFKEVCKAYDYEGVILGHHLDDQAETVLKRLFEGASLSRLSGLKKVTIINGLKILRPFLDVRKRQLESLLNEKKIISFFDKTNQDPKYLRARFRTQIIPFLNQEFKKDITEPLYRLGCEALQLKEYLDNKFESYKKDIVKNEFGSSFDFSKISLPFEVKYFIRVFVEEEGFLLPYNLIETALHLINSNASNKFLYIKDRKIHFNRKKMSIMKCH